MATDRNDPHGATLDEMDFEAFFGIQQWLQEALAAKGAKIVGGGVGLREAVVDIEVDGCRYSVSIKPLAASLGKHVTFIPISEEDTCESDGSGC